MRLLVHVPDQWREFLDNWKLWIGVAYFGIVCVMVALFFVNQRTSHTLANQARASAINTAERRASATSDYKQCVASIPLIASFARHVSGVNAGFEALVANSRDGLAATPNSDPLYPVRLGNLLRLEAAAKDVAAVVGFPVPTVSTCAARRSAALAK